MPTLWVNINFQNDMEEKSLTLAQEEQIRKNGIRTQIRKETTQGLPDGGIW